jgi:hypothetical protein
VGCPLGFTLSQCIEDHWCRALNGERSGAHWRARCPACLRQDAFEISISGTGTNARLKWNCHTKPACDHDRIRAMLAQVLSCKMAASGKGSDAALAEIRKLLCAGLDPAETKLRIGQVVWPERSAAQVADVLGLSRATRYRLRCPPSAGR